jgi:heat shock protein HslJ
LKRKILLLIVNIVLGAVLFLTSCTATTPPPTSPKPTPTLENTTWVLQSYGQPGNTKPVLTSAGPLTDIKITAVFDSSKGEVTGSSGVNTYGATYELKDNKLTISGLTVTLLGGPQPLIDQEHDYLNLLQASESFQITDSQLQINCGQQVLVFMED